MMDQSTNVQQFVIFSVKYVKNLQQFYLVIHMKNVNQMVNYLIVENSFPLKMLNEYAKLVCILYSKKSKMKICLKNENYKTFKI